MHVQAASPAMAGAASATVANFLELRDRSAGRLPSVGSLYFKAPGETLFTEGEEADSIYEVVRGLLRLYKLLPDGRRQITRFLAPGDMVGLAPAEIYAFTAEAVTKVALRRHKRAAFERLIDEEPGFARSVLRQTSDELCAAQEQILLLGRKCAAEKVASFLLLIADRQGSEAEEVEVPMTRSDIADYLGLTIETVSRTLTKLKQDELIALPSPGRILILDREQLESLAAGEGAAGF